MKNCLIIANCFTWEIERHLNQSEQFKSNYEITRLTTYTSVPDIKYLEFYAKADLIISQNVKNINEYKNSFISEKRKIGSIHIRTEFWRFNGFWPYKSNNERINNWFWYPVDEFGPISFKDYMNFEIDASLIKNNFDNELNKFLEIDSLSDIKIQSLFLDSWGTCRLFSDNWHPMPQIFSFVCNEILKIIGINDHIGELPANSINSNRYRIITNSIKDALGICYNTSDDELHFF